MSSCPPPRSPQYTPALVNGELKASVNLFDRGFMYGDGLFETVRVVNGQAPLWRYHCQRLETGCRQLKIKTDTGLLKRLLAGLQEVVGEAGRTAETCVVKIMITRGVGGRGYQTAQHCTASEIIICYPAPDYPSAYAREGILVSTCQHRLSENPLLAGIKHLNRLDQVLASTELDDSVAEGLMLDQQGQVIEGTKSNILLFKNHEIVSPITTSCGVDGVARSFIFDNLSTLGAQGRFEHIKPEQISEFDGMAIVNSVLGIWPVRMLDGVELPISPLVFDIQRLFNDLLNFEYMP